MKTFNNKFLESSRQPLADDFTQEEKLELIINTESAISYAKSTDFPYKITYYLDWDSFQNFIAVNHTYFQSGMDFLNSLDEKSRDNRVQKALEAALPLLEDIRPTLYNNSLSNAQSELFLN